MDPAHSSLKVQQSKRKERIDASHKLVIAILCRQLFRITHVSTASSYFQRPPRGVHEGVFARKL